MQRGVQACMCALGTECYRFWPANQTNCVPRQMHLTYSTQGGTHTGHTHKRTHTCTVMQMHTGKERRSQRKLRLFIMPFYSMHTVLLPPLQMSVFHYVLNLSAGHSYDNSKSVLLPKCQEGEMTINRGSIKMNIKRMLKIRWAKWDKVRRWNIYYIKDSKNM